MNPSRPIQNDENATVIRFVNNQVKKIATRGPIIASSATTHPQPIDAGLYPSSSATNRRSSSAGSVVVGTSTTSLQPVSRSAAKFSRIASGSDRRHNAAIASAALSPKFDKYS